MRLNVALFEWVIENLCKNAVDAMGGVGVLVISVQETSRYWCIDVADTGKGIDKRYFETVFAPGYTTKKRGWGLGLSLARRIVVEYHSGSIFVKQSEINKGTIFRIELKNEYFVANFYIMRIIICIFVARINKRSFGKV